MLSASTLAWRTACCALGGQVASGSLSRLDRSGTLAQSPAAQITPSWPCTCMAALATTRLRWSSGRPASASTGLAVTPAVQMIVSLSYSVPSDSCTWPFSTLCAKVLR